jgi:selenocysteine-specific elongation factor
LSEEWSEEEDRVQAVFEYLVHEGVLVKIKSGIYFHRVPFDHLKEELISYLKDHKEITTPHFKEMTGASRKYAIPLIEYFDQMKLTLRVGEKRVLRGLSQEVGTKDS